MIEIKLIIKEKVAGIQVEVDLEATIYNASSIESDFADKIKIAIQETLGRLADNLIVEEHNDIKKEVDEDSFFDINKEIGE